MHRVPRTIRACLIIFCLVPVSILAISSSARDKEKEPARTAVWPEARGYRKWTRVNPTPLLLPAPLDFLCRAPMAREVIQTSQNPHRTRYFTVFVNGIGRDAMLHQAKPVFPQGTIILKEKQVKRNSASPELMTVMVKREKGFAPADGDWEYLVLDGKGRRVTFSAPPARTDMPKGAYCQSCHAMNAQTDYVFRSYLPASIRKQLHLNGPETRG